MTGQGYGARAVAPKPSEAWAQPSVRGSTVGRRRPGLGRLEVGGPYRHLRGGLGAAGVVLRRGGSLSPGEVAAAAFFARRPSWPPSSWPAPSSRWPSSRRRSAGVTFLAGAFSRREPSSPAPSSRAPSLARLGRARPAGRARRAGPPASPRVPARPRGVPARWRSCRHRRGGRPPRRRGRRRCGPAPRRPGPARPPGRAPSRRCRLGFLIGLQSGVLQLAERVLARHGGSLPSSVP